MSVYYNEIDPFSAAWLRELIKADMIAAGDVDERSIVDVKASDVRGYRQAHFFAGIGVWSYALRRAGWADDRAVWTGSCPCQPFSSAGKGDGADDSRHLWPVWFELIKECRPDVVFGEQVASADGLGWLDLVHADMEAAGYALGAVDCCAAGVGAPHIRQRLFFVANADGRDALHGDLQRGREHGLRTEDRHDVRAARDSEWAESAVAHDDKAGRGRVGASRLHDHGQPGHDVDRCSTAGDMGDTTGDGLSDQPDASADRARRAATSGTPEGCAVIAGDSGGHGDMGYPASIGLEAGQQQDRAQHAGTERQGWIQQPGTRSDGFWAACDWLPCRDGKARPVEPGTFPLVAGAPARVGRLRGYGNAINAEVAAAFIDAYLGMHP